MNIMVPRCRVLVVDDEIEMCDALVERLGGLGFAATGTTNPTDALEKVESTEFDVAMVDVVMPTMDGYTLCSQLTARHPHVGVVIMTGKPSFNAAIGALRSHACDFLAKPVDPGQLANCVTRAARLNNLRRELAKSSEGRAFLDGPHALVGDSPPMRALDETILRVASSDASVLIQGETGTGKELVARNIHSRSSRARGPFVAINCAAVPPSLVESELFGHVQGAFTDAKAPRQGLFVEARGGTLFLDEIGELPADVQPKLLRALQQRVVRPVGSNDEIPFDSRIVTATNRPLDVEVAAKRFREDLFYRIAVVTIAVPPLRDRGFDILKISEHLLAKLGPSRGMTLSIPAAERLLAHDWPGNVRELENCLERAVALARSDEIAVADLPPTIAHQPDSVVPPLKDEAAIVPLVDFGMSYIHRVLRRLNGNKTHAAELLGIDRRTLHRKLARERARRPKQGAA